MTGTDTVLCSSGGMRLVGVARRRSCAGLELPARLAETTNMAMFVVEWNSNSSTDTSAREAIKCGHGYGRAADYRGMSVAVKVEL